MQISTPHITQIEGKHVNSEKTFNCCVTQIPISSASGERVTNIVVTSGNSMCVDRKILLSRGIMKSSTAENVASYGLNFKHLIYLRSGEDGIYYVFTMRNSDDLPRVTNAKRLL